MGHSRRFRSVHGLYYQVNLRKIYQPMTANPEGSRIGWVYVAAVGHQEPKHSYKSPRHQILVHRQEEEMSEQGDVVVVAFGWGEEWW